MQWLSRSKFTQLIEERGITEGHVHKAYLVSSILKRSNGLWPEPLRSLVYMQPFTSNYATQNRKNWNKLYLKPRSVVKETQIHQAFKLYVGHSIKATEVLKLYLAPGFPPDTRSSWERLDRGYRKQTAPRGLYFSKKS